MALMAHWKGIVGVELAEYTWPLSIVANHKKEATLYVAVRPAYALNAWSKVSLLTERVNAFFGHEAIYRVRLVKKTDMHAGNKGATLSP